MKIKRKLQRERNRVRPTQASRIKADVKAQAPNNSYGPPEYYEDFEFACADCGKVEVWTAEQQRVYFEVWKKPIYGRAKHCHACRKRRLAANAAQRERSRQEAKRA